METIELDENLKTLPCQHCLDEVQDIVSEDETIELFAELGYTIGDLDD
jgi:hypothetical protein